VDAEVFHYGYVRPPDLMFRRSFDVTRTYWGERKASLMMKDSPEYFEYGSLEKLHVYTESIPVTMGERVDKMDWAQRLQYRGRSGIKHKHDRLKYRILTFLEQKVFRGKFHLGYRNWILVRRK
jgi:hypothetical protein